MMGIEPVKVLLCAHSGNGKTGANASLAAAGYKLRYLDLDNGVDVLRNFLSDPLSPYVIAQRDVGKNLDSIISLSEKRKSVGGKLSIAKAEVWAKASSQIEEWKDGERNLGSITSWDTSHVLCIGSFTRLAESAIRFVQFLNGRLNQHPFQSDYGDAQNLLRSFLEIVTSPEVRCNLVLECHIESIEQGDGTFQDFPRAVGKALAPIIGTYFNTLLQIKKVGQGTSLKRTIHTVPTGTLGVKNTAPFKVKAEYALETGLAEYFTAVRGA
jgi:hypothetical protein